MSFRDSSLGTARLKFLQCDRFAAFYQAFIQLFGLLACELRWQEPGKGSAGGHFLKPYTLASISLAPRSSPF